MRRYARYVLLAVSVTGGCLLAGGFAVSQTGYTNSLCSSFMTCTAITCMTADGQCSNGPYTQYKVIVVSSATCSPFASYTCWLTPKNVCWTTYYWNSPQCNANDAVCSQFIQSGYNCTNTGP
jgi:hypothetical protein